MEKMYNIYIPLRTCIRGRGPNHGPFLENTIRRIRSRGAPAEIVAVATFFYLHQQKTPGRNPGRLVLPKPMLPITS
jgi:hypothetical protein